MSMPDRRSMKSIWRFASTSSAGSPFGPGWLRGWIPLFFAVLIVASLLVKILWRLH